MKFSSRTRMYCLMFSSAVVFVIALFYKFSFHLHLHNFLTLQYNESSSYEGSKVSDIIRETIDKDDLIWKQLVLTRNKSDLELQLSVKNHWEVSDYNKIWDFFYQKFNCSHRIDRLGRAGDGGKWVCGISHLAKKAKSCVVYSYGVAGDTSFEEDVLNKTSCTVRAFDPTVDSKNVAVTKKYPTRSSFYKIGLGSNDSGNIRTLKTEMIMHDEKFLDILKMDIDGKEYESLRQILKDFPSGLPFGQLIIEIHLHPYGLTTVHQNKLFSELKSWWESLEIAGLRPFSREPNPSSNCCFEYSFLNIRMNHTLLYS